MIMMQADKIIWYEIILLGNHATFYNFPIKRLN